MEETGGAVAILSPVLDKLTADVNTLLPMAIGLGVIVWGAVWLFGVVRRAVS